MEEILTSFIDTKYENICVKEKKLLELCIHTKKDCDLFKKLYDDCVKFKATKKVKKN